MKIGYARVSSSNQDLELQKEELLKAGCQKIYSESVSAKDNNRTELIAMIGTLRPDDVVVVYKIDRIARSLKGLIEIAKLLKEKSVDLISIDSSVSKKTISDIKKSLS